MHSNMSVRSHLRLVLQLVGICALYCAATGVAYAAAPLSGKQSGWYGAGKDTALGSLDLAWYEEDCEDESYLWSLPDGSSTSASVPGFRADSVNGTALAKLDTTAKSSSSQKKGADTRTLVAASPSANASLPPEPEAIAVAAPASDTPKWEISPSDKTLNASLARWAAIAGWQLVWELPVDYAVEARTVVPGTFKEAVEVVARSMSTAEIPMKAIFYQGNKVLRIVAKGSE